MCIKYYLTHKGRFLIVLSARERGKLCEENTQLGGFHLVKATGEATFYLKEEMTHWRSEHQVSPSSVQGRDQGI